MMSLNNRALIFSGIILTLTFLLGTLFRVSAQVPTAQDCLGALPICQNVYSTTASYSGTGNYTDEINSLNSCLASGEKNDVWYTFTVINSGNLSFLITPNQLSDDYDWAVYNLTNANCSDIYSNSALEVSCNYSADGGTTGPNGGSSFNSQDASGTPYNATIPVTAGQTYVINISNYSSTQYGYTINFGASTATIFDNVPPEILSVSQPIACGATTLTFTFSENVLCSTVQNSDFTLTGPGGPYTLSGVTGAACAVGGTQENTFTIAVSPAITSGGAYTLNLVGPVTDLCGNVAPPNSLPFNISLVAASITNVTDASCGSNNGSATVTATGGSGTYSYSWSTAPPQTTATATGLAPGNYSVTVSDGGCSNVQNVTINSVGSATLTVNPASAQICNGGSVVITASGVDTYNWLPAAGLSSTTDSIVTASPVTTTVYTVSGSTLAGCTGSATVTVTVAPAPAITFNPANPAICDNDSVMITASGATSYSWAPPAGLSATSGSSVMAAPAVSTTYTVTGDNGTGCTSSATVYVFVGNNADIQFIADTNRGCQPLYVQFTDLTDPVPQTWEWNFGDPSSGASNHSFWQNPSHWYENEGIYDVSLTVTSSGSCSGTLVIPGMIRVFKTPVANFYSYPEATTILEPMVRFFEQTVGADGWYWDFGDPDDYTNNSNAPNPIHYYQDTGSYNVMLVALTVNGCSDTVYHRVTIEPNVAFYAPNAFTPNNDTRNDVFYIFGEGIDNSTFEMRIFNRWGEQVFFSADMNSGWSGRVGEGGKLLPEGAYSWAVTFRDVKQKPHKYRGTVILVR